MKKNLILILTTFLIFSCSLENEKKEVLEKTQTWEIEKELQECLKKNPLEETHEMAGWYYYWAFKNKNDNLCYYLWFYYFDFFIVDENLKKNWLNDKKLKDINLDEFWHHKYNLLFWEKNNEIHRKIYDRLKLQVPSNTTIFLEKNLLEIFDEKFKELNIVLPENKQKIQSIEEEYKVSNKYIIKKIEFTTTLFNRLKIKKNEKWEIENFDEIDFEKIHFDKIPKYLYNIDFENLYEILKERQKK